MNFASVMHNPTGKIVNWRIISSKSCYFCWTSDWRTEWMRNCSGCSLNSLICDEVLLFITSQISSKLFYSLRLLATFRASLSSNSLPLFAQMLKIWCSSSYWADIMSYRYFVLFSTSKILHKNSAACFLFKGFISSRVQLRFLYSFSLSCYLIVITFTVVVPSTSFCMKFSTSLLASLLSSSIY